VQSDVNYDKRGNRQISKMKELEGKLQAIFSRITKVDHRIKTGLLKKGKHDAKAVALCKKKRVQLSEQRDKILQVMEDVGKVLQDSDFDTDNTSIASSSNLFEEEQEVMDSPSTTGDDSVDSDHKGLDPDDKQQKLRWSKACESRSSTHSCERESNRSSLTSAHSGLRWAELSSSGLADQSG